MRIVGIFLLTSLVAAGNPPQLQPDARNLEQVVVLGNNVTVRCPILTPVDFVVWKHNAKELQLNVRYRTSHRGWLKIVRVSNDDAGRYTCQAVNGFGSVEANITLVVHDPNIGDAEMSQQHNFYPVADDILDGKEKSIKPTLLESSRFRFETIQRPTGSNIKFKCLVDGSPKPKVFWLKNGRRLIRTDLNPESHFSRWSLNLMNLQESDSGLYTCVGHNLYGTVNKNFTLEVVGKIDAKPEIIGTEPVNITIIAGNTATFHCRVKSAVKPHIKWLKQVEDEKAKNDQQLLFENNEHYRVLKAGETMEHEQGIYLNKFHIVNVQESNSSKYICLAANVRGYNAGVYHLRVLPRFDQESRRASPLPLTVIIISVIIIIVMVIIGIVITKHRYTQVKKGEILHKSHDEDVVDDTNTWLQQETSSNIASSTNAGTVESSSSHYHQHHHHHHHYGYKR